MKRFVFCVMVVMGLLGALPVAAQPRPSRADRHAVRRLMVEALQLASRPESRETAADRFLQAYEHIPNCAFLANAARLLREFERRHADARRHAQRVINGECQPSEDGTDRRIAQDILAALVPAVQPPTQVVPSPDPVPAPAPAPVLVPAPVIAPVVVHPTPPRAPVVPALPPRRYAESRPVPGASLGLWIGGGLTFAAGALCLGWYVDAESRKDDQSADTDRWARASSAALTTAIPTLLIGAGLVVAGTVFYAFRPTRRVEILPAVSTGFTGLQAGFRF